VFHRLWSAALWSQSLHSRAVLCTQRIRVERVLWSFRLVILTRLFWPYFSYIWLSYVLLIIMLFLTCLNLEWILFVSIITSFLQYNFFLKLDQLLFWLFCRMCCRGYEFVVLIWDELPMFFITIRLQRFFVSEPISLPSISTIILLHNAALDVLYLYNTLWAR